MSVTHTCEIVLYRCALGHKWELIDASRACEVNSEGIERFFVATRMRDLSCCQQLCEDLCMCNAVDYYTDTSWCNLFETACSQPRKRTEGASSYRLT